MVEAVTENMANGIRFRLGDIVETVKGAKFWGEIIAFDTDEASPGCTVRAVDPGFEGTKHVYPLKQLRHRPKDRPLPAPVTVETTDLSTEIDRTLPNDFPNYGDFSIALPAGHWRAIRAALAASDRPAAAVPRPALEWHEDYGDVVWWALGEDGRWLGEAPYIGSPLDCGRPILVTVDGEEMTRTISGWPGYHTHWTPCPAFPSLPTVSGSAGK